MRISGGSARGIPIGTGGARHVRPATDRMREAVFSSLGQRVGDAAVLDLFAGSGSYGLEALSRGAGTVLFIEKHPRAVAVLQENLIAVCRSMGHPEKIRTRVIRRDVLRFESATRFDLVFMDPPYDLARSRTADLLGLAEPLLQPGGVLVFELPADLQPATGGWRLLRRLGKSGSNEPAVLLLSPHRDKPGGGDRLNRR